MFRTIARAIALSLVGLLTPAVVTVGGAQELDYEFIAPTSGSISYNGLPGGTLQGSGIDLDLIVGLSTPVNANVGRVCVSCTCSFTSGPLVSSSSTMWTFAAGGSIVVTGGVDLDNNGVINGGDIPLGTTLFSGSFDTPVTIAVLAGGFRVIGGGFSNTQASALSAFFGLPTGAAVYSGGLNLSFGSSVAPPNAFSSTQLFSGNMANSAPASTPTPTDTPTNTPTDTATNTPTSTPSDTATEIATPTPTETPTATATMSSTPQSTNTPTQTPTGTPTNSETPTNTPTTTQTPSSTPTNTTVPSNTPTNTGVPSSTPTSTAVPSSTPTNTGVPSSTPTSTAVPSSTPTNTGVPSGTPTNTIGSTATPTSTQTPTRTLEIVEETATPQVAVDLAIEKRFADPACSRGQAGRYILTVRNLGGSTPSAPVLTDTLPAGVTMTDITASGWDCSASTATVVQCTADSAFGPGESRSIEVTVAIALIADPALVNTASVSAQTGELDLTNNTVTIVTLCVGGPTGAPAMGPIGFAIAIALLGAVAYWRLRGALDE